MDAPLYRAADPSVMFPVWVSTAPLESVRASISAVPDMVSVALSTVAEPMWVSSLSVTTEVPALICREFMLACWPFSSRLPCCTCTESSQAEPLKLWVLLPTLTRLRRPSPICCMLVSSTVVVEDSSTLSPLDEP